MPLPTVKKEIAGSITAEWNRDNFAKFFHALLKRLKKENPIIVEVLNRFSENLFRQGLTVDPATIIHAGLLVYSLLEGQQEANDLED